MPPAGARSPSRTGSGGDLPREGHPYPAGGRPDPCAGAPPSQIKPASLGSAARRYRDPGARLLPAGLRHRLGSARQFEIHRIPLRPGAVLEKAACLIVPLQEALALPPTSRGRRQCQRARPGGSTFHPSDHRWRDRVRPDRPGLCRPPCRDLAAFLFGAGAAGDATLNQIHFRRGSALLDMMPRSRRARRRGGAGGRVGAYRGGSLLGRSAATAGRPVGYRAKPAYQADRSRPDLATTILRISGRRCGPARAGSSLDPGAFYPGQP